METGYIYALRNRHTHKIDYVGSTFQPTKRWNHLFTQPKTKLYRKRAKYSFMIIRKVEASRMLTVEHRIIRAFKRKRQCRFNNHTRFGIAIKCLETGEVFQTTAEACRKLSINRGKLSEAFKRGTPAVIRSYSLIQIFDL